MWLRLLSFFILRILRGGTQVERLEALEQEMADANAEYVQAVNRASK